MKNEQLAHPLLYLLIVIGRTGCESSTDHTGGAAIRFRLLVTSAYDTGQGARGSRVPAGAVLDQEAGRVPLFLYPAR